MLKIDDMYYFEYEIIGEFHSAGNWIHPKRIIDSYELIFVLEGVVHIKENEDVYELKANESLILEPGKLHEGITESTCPTAFYWFHFRTNMPMPFKVSKSGEFYDVKNLLKKLLHISQTPSYDAAAADAAGLMIFYELGNIDRTGNSLAGKIAEYIRINNNQTVAEVAEYFGYNADYISKLFKKYFGMAVKQYINIQRMNCAKDLLLTTDLSVKQISAKMGFSDENLFIKFFIYHEDISPARFRNKYFNTHMNNK